MTTNIITVLLIVALGLAIETTIVSDVCITICTTSEPGSGTIPPPHQ